MDYANPYKLINYIALFVALERSSYPAWEIEENDLKKLKYRGATTNLKPVELFKGEHKPVYEAGLIDDPEAEDSKKSSALMKYGHALGFGLVPAILAIPGINLPMWARGLVLCIALGFVVWHIIGLLRIPRLETSSYKPAIIGRYKRYGRKMTGLRLFGRGLGFLALVAIQIGAVYAWVTIPLRDFNIFLYLVATLFVWGLTFGYFSDDPRGTNLDSDKEEMIKYVIIEDVKNGKPSQKESQRINFFVYVLVWLVISFVVWFFRPNFIDETLHYFIATGSALVAVLVARRPL